MIIKIKEIPGSFNTDFNVYARKNDKDVKEAKELVDSCNEFSDKTGVGVQWSERMSADLSLFLMNSKQIDYLFEDIGGFDKLEEEKEYVLTIKEKG